MQIIFMHSFRQSINMIYFSYCKTSDKMLISHARLLLTFTMPLCTLFYYSFVFFFQFKNRREDRERKGSIPFHHTGKKRQRRMGVPFLMHEDHLDVSPTRSTFSFGSFSGLGDDRRTLDRGGWPSTIMGM